MSFYFTVNKEGKEILRLQIPENKRVVLGRAAEADLRVPEAYLSRAHAVLLLQGEQLTVTKIPGSKNPMYHKGINKDQFILQPHERFAIGESLFIYLGSDVHSKTEQQEAMAMDQKVKENLESVKIMKQVAIHFTKNPALFFKKILELVCHKTDALWSCVAKESGEIIATVPEKSTMSYTVKISLVKKAIQCAPEGVFVSWSNDSKKVTEWAMCAAVKIKSEPYLILYAAGQNDKKEKIENIKKMYTQFVSFLSRLMSRDLS